ncbi:hypothetical protein CTI12_AA443510 [Artemisia annua]|uniref:Reverse transcriptase domain-containing protein n=1 Tax=Artemisia annua TaxID=35608 RepID=A0A2U1LX88_ARTAN|nr:hypothetical protein CTI12_AA443510 [Artemisia annua]
MARGAGKTHIGPGNGAKYRVGPQGWYTKIKNRPPFANIKVSLEEMVNMHFEESSKKYSKFQEWMDEMKVDTERNLRNQSAAIKNLKAQIGQLAKKFQFEKPEVEFEECKVLSLSKENKETERNTGSEKKFCRVSYQRENNVAYGRMPSQLPDKEPNPGKFLLPCTIGNFDMFALADLGASVNMMSFSLFKKLNLINFKKTTSMVEMADMSRTTPKGTVFEKEITLENGKEKITFNHNGSLKSINTNLEEVCMIKEANIASTPTNVDLYTKPVLCDSDSCEDCNTNHFEERVSYSKHAQNRHNRIMSRVMDERNPALKNHYCNPIIMGSNRTMTTINEISHLMKANVICPKKVYNERLCSAETGECSNNIPPEDSNQHFKIKCTNPKKNQKGAITRLMNGLRKGSVPRI